jgi:hypothetical protein
MTEPKPKKLSSRERQKRRWIEETQMYQRVAKVKQSTYEELEVEYERLFKKEK